MNTFQLKWIAIVAMAVDHTGAVLFPGNAVFRCIGRLAFPIFCFLLVEGFCHTRDLHRYMGRLALFSLLSEIPFDLAFVGVPFEFRHQNVFFTLFFGVAMMYFMEKYHAWYIRSAVALFFMWVAETILSDYGGSGILLILIYYVFREHRKTKLILGAGWNFFFSPGIQWFGAGASVPIAFYNGKKGPGMKYFFYVFYPAHLLLLYAIQRYTG